MIFYGIFLPETPLIASSLWVSNYPIGPSAANSCPGTSSGSPFSFRALAASWAATACSSSLCWSSRRCSSASNSLYSLAYSSLSLLLPALLTSLSLCWYLKYNCDILYNIEFSLEKASEAISTVFCIAIE